MQNMASLAVLLQIQFTELNSVMKIAASKDWRFRKPEYQKENSSGVVEQKVVQEECVYLKLKEVQMMK